MVGLIPPPQKKQKQKTPQNINKILIPVQYPLLIFLRDLLIPLTFSSILDNTVHSWFVFNQNQENLHQVLISWLRWYFDTEV